MENTNHLFQEILCEDYLLFFNGRASEQDDNLKDKFFRDMDTVCEKIGESDLLESPSVLLKAISKKMGIKRNLTSKLKDIFKCDAL